MKYHLITIACLLLALVCYLVGLGTGAIVLAGIGVLLEFAFWFRLFRKPKSGAKPPSALV